MTTNFVSNEAMGYEFTLTFAAGQFAPTGNQNLFCYFQKILNLKQYGPPLVAETCQFTSPAYTFKVPQAGITAGKYLLTITTFDDNPAGVVFPTTQDRFQAVVTTTDKEDQVFFDSLPYYLSSADMVLTSKYSESLQILEIYFTKPSTMAIPAATANSKDVIVYIDFITSQFEVNLDAQTINGISYGQRFPCKVYDNNVEDTDIKLKLLYSTKTLENDKNEYARLALLNFPDGTSTNQFQIKIPYIKNAKKQMNFKLTFVHYSTNGPYPIYLFEHDFTGMKNMEDSVAVTPITSRIDHISTHFYTWMSYDLNFQLIFPTIADWNQWDGKCDQIAFQFDEKASVRIEDQAAITTVGIGKLEYFETINLYVFKPNLAAVFGTYLSYSKLTLYGVPMGKFVTQLGINTNLFAYEKQFTSSISKLQLEISTGLQALYSFSTLETGKYTNEGSVRKCQIKFKYSIFPLIVGSYVEIRFDSTKVKPLGLHTDELSYCQVHGMTDNLAGNRKVNCYLDETTASYNSFIIEGYNEVPKDTEVTVTFYAKPQSPSTIYVQLFIYEKFGDVSTLMTKTSQKTLSASVLDWPSVSETLVYNHELYVYATQLGPLCFKIKSNNALLQDYTVKITMPDSFTWPTGITDDQIRAQYGPKFDELIEFESVSWDSGSFTLSMEIFEDISIPADSEYIILLDTIFFDPSSNGILRGVDAGTEATPAANLYQFKMVIADANPTETEIKISDFVSYPPESGVDAEMIFMTYQRGFLGGAEFKYKILHTVNADDQIRIDYSTDESLTNRYFEFPENLGMPLFPTGNRKHALSGAEPINIHVMSDVQLEGVAIRGSATARRPAQFIIPIKKPQGVGVWIDFYLIDITNPKEENVWVVVPFSITRPCRDDGYQCQYLRKNFKYKIIEDTEDFPGKSVKLPVTDEYCCNVKKSQFGTTQYKCYSGYNTAVCKPTVPSKTIYSQYVERLDETHNFTFMLEMNYVDSTDYLIVHYPTYNYYPIESVYDGSCSSSNWCLTFPHQQCYLIKLGSDYAHGSNPYPTMTHMKNGYYRNDIGGGANAYYQIKHTKFVANGWTKINKIARYYQPEWTALTWNEFPDNGTYITQSGKWDTVRAYMEPTQTILRKYPLPLTAPQVLNPTIYDYDPINQDDITYAAQFANKYYFLDDYMNTVKFQARFIWNRIHINYFYIIAHSHWDPELFTVNSMNFYTTSDPGCFGQQYCNATFDYDNSTGVDPFVKSHPIQLKCDIINSQLIRIYPSGYYPFPDWNFPSFANGVITVYFKFYPKYFDLYEHWEGGTWSNNFNTNVQSWMYLRMCGNVNKWTYSWTTCQNYYPIFAPWYHPYTHELSFHHESFQDRIGVMNEETDLYFGIKPNTQWGNYSTGLIQINQFVFHIPDNFSFPYDKGIESLQNWRVYGAEEYAESSFALNRINAETLVTVDVSNYTEHNLTTVRLTNSATNKFITPSIAGDAYQVGLKMNQDGNLLEVGVANFTIVGDPILQFVSKPSKDAVTKDSLFQFSFKTGTYLTPEGYATPSNTRYSSLQIVFENMKIMNGYLNDLGTGLETGDEIGCHCLIGLVLKNKDRYQCFIKLGTSPEDKPWIEMFNYEEIQPSTEITIMLTGLTTIADTKWTYTYAGIRVYYKETYGIVQYYDLVNDISEVQETPETIATHSTGTIEITGSKYVHEQSNYVLNLTLAHAIAGSTSSDFLKIIFPNDLFNKYQDVRKPTCSLGNLFMMGVANTIYLQPTATLAAGAAISIDINNLENPQYSMESQTFDIVVQELSGDKLRDRFTFSIVCEFTYSENLTLFEVSTNNSIGGKNNVTYQLTVSTGHKIPNEGYLKIQVPQIYGQLSVLGVGCFLEGFGSQTTCKVNANDIEVYFNGDAFNESLTYKIYLTGMNNPNQLMTTKKFQIFSQYSVMDPLKIISSKKASAPPITLETVFNCTLKATIKEQTEGELTDYDFKFSCDTDIRDSSEVRIVMPEEFRKIYLEEIKLTADEEKVVECWTDNIYFLRDNNCIMTISDQVIVTVKVNSYNAKTSLNIVLKQLQNPSPAGRVTGFFIECESKNILYAKSVQPALIIISSNDYQLTSKDQQIGVHLQNIPITAGQAASYIFAINVLEMTPSYIFTSVDIDFTQYFQYGVGEELECGAFFSDSNKDLSYSQTLELFYSNRSNYISLPCTVDERRVTITNVDEIIKTKKSQYACWVIRNVINPSRQLIHELTIKYSSGTASIYKLIDNFTIVLSQSPSELYLSKDIYLTTYNIKNYAYYRFFVQLTEDLISYDQLGLLIKLPNSYKEVESYQNQSGFYCDSSLNSVPGTSLDCKFYGINLLITAKTNLELVLQNQTKTYSFDIMISEMMNPLIETTCSTTSSSLTNQFQFYEIQLINLKNGDIISRNYQANDMKNCVEFVKDLYAIKISVDKKVYPGFSYILTITLEQPYDGILLVPQIASTNHRITFNATKVQFNDFIHSTQDLLMIVDKSAKPGNYSIKWTKTETKHLTAFMEVMDTQVIVIEEAVKPKVLIEKINVIGVNQPYDIAVSLEQPAAFEVCLNSKFVIQNKNQQWLRHIIYTSPKKLCFSQGETIKYLTLFTKFELNSQILQFSLSPSDASKIYNLTETQKTIYIEDQPKEDQCYIFSIRDSDINKNHAYLHILVSEQSKIYYILTYRNSIAPTKDQFISLSYNYSINSGTLHTSLPTQMLEQASVYFNLTNLEANTKYTLFAIARGRHSYSQIYKFDFETKALSNAALIRFKVTSQNISDIKLKTAFASALCIYQERFIIINKHKFDEPINSSIMNERPAIYEMLIQPNVTDDYKTPIEYAQMLTNSYYYKKLKKALPEIKDTFDLSYREYVIDEIKVAREPKMILVTYYNATISMRFWKKSKVYAIRMCQDVDANFLKKLYKPLSQQIYKGFDENNNKLNLTKYYTYEGMTDYYGEIDIFFDDLQPEKECTVFITAGTYVPFNPPKLMDDSEVRSITFQTCLLYTSDAADEEDSVDLGGRRIIKKKKKKTKIYR
eukprot:TRINITY_DN5975_c0_g1_i1.p1 TRINITY_DN5975_c0_g1~~TRINITY_DN5975_c0_g1_i1.p1  ORF type:complete len:3014 (-),score=332.15 TRINITY_DN5975_c0_g1_i1:53-9094(-)